MSLIDSIDEGPQGSGIASGFFGLTGAQAAASGSMAQTEASRQAIELLRGNLSPFVDLGAQAAGNLQNLVTPQGQAEFLNQSPVFANLSDQASKDIFASQAAKGKLGSGGTAEAVQSSIFQLGNQLIDQQINRQLPLVNIGQSSAARQGAGSVDLLTGLGNAQAAGFVGAQNALSQGGENAIQLATAIASGINNNNNTQGGGF